jgi:hypothetical protein
MFNLKITMPTYRLNNYKNFHVFGELQVSAEVDVLSEGYQDLKLKVDELLRSVEAENQVVLDLASLHQKIVSQTRVLHRLEEKIIAAEEQLQRLEAFLKLLGINPASYSLGIDNKVLRPILEARSTEVKAETEAEVDPIPFDEDSEDEDSEDEDSEDERRRLKDSYF